MKNRRAHKRFNQKARQGLSNGTPSQAKGPVSDDLIDSNIIKLDKELEETCNSFILTKSQEKVKSHLSHKQQPAKKLTKKQKKKVAHILDQKEKKVQRESLLTELRSNQISDAELCKLASAASVYSGNANAGSVRKELTGAKPTENVQKIRTVAGVGKQLRRLQESESESDVDSSSGDDEEVPKHSLKNTIKDEPIEIVNDKVSKAVIDNDSENEMTSKDNTLNDIHSMRKSLNFCAVSRIPQIEKDRKLLPILADEQVIMEKINENPVVIICGETGCGKSTQIPQFLYEAGYSAHGLIGITEPRRVAAMSVSSRVAHEMNVTSDIVSFQIRHEGNVTDQTKIKFMTDGVLLKEVQKDFLLTKYSAIVIDEAHERSVFTDILIGLLSRIINVRAKRKCPLKLIVMSATLHVESFVENKSLFPDRSPPVINVAARQYPVVTHFAKTTPTDYVTGAFDKVVEIHRTMPLDGAILVFVTGQDEINVICKKLNVLFGGEDSDIVTEKKEEAKSESEGEMGDDGVEKEAATSLLGRDEDEKELNAFVRNQRKLAKAKPATGIKRKRGHKRKANGIGEDENVPTTPAIPPPRIDLNKFSLKPSFEMDNSTKETPTNAFDESDNDDIGSDDGSDGVDGNTNADLLTSLSHLPTDTPLHVLPLFSLLPSSEQAKVFEPPPTGHRLCVVATNVAETSLTIPNVKYVVDTGRAKTKYYDKVTGVSTFMIGWASKASIEQRSGRAGRTAPGHAYRLFSSAVFTDEFADFAPPEISRRPIDDLVLQMKFLGIEHLKNFPFPTPPSDEAILAAEKLLLSLGALAMKRSAKKKMNVPVITPLGRVMAQIPVAPRFSRILVAASEKSVDLLKYALAIIAALSIQEFLVVFNGKNNNVSLASVGESFKLGDLAPVLKIVGAIESKKLTSKSFQFREVCQSYGVRVKAMTEWRKLVKQLGTTIDGMLEKGHVANLKRLGKTSTEIEPRPKFRVSLASLGPPSEEMFLQLRKAFVYGMADRIAKRIPPTEESLKNKNSLTYQTMASEKPALIHPTSVFAHLSSGSASSTAAPDWMFYQELVETNKFYIRGCTAIDPSWLVNCRAHCHFSPPLPEPASFYAKGEVMCYCSVTYGPLDWLISPSLAVTHPEGMIKIKTFSKFLLEGVVCPRLAKYSKCLLTPPDIILKPWVSMHKESTALINALVTAKVDSNAKLFKIWSDPGTKDFLRREYCSWLPASLHDDIDKLWPPLPKAQRAKLMQEIEKRDSIASM